MLTDESSLARAHIAARARTQASELLEMLRGTIPFIAHPDKQHEVQAFVDQVIGNDMVKPATPEITGPHTYTPTPGFPIHRTSQKVEAVEVE